MNKVIFATVVSISCILISSVASAASYQVPGFEAEDQSYSFKFRLKQKGSQLSSRYKLPADLTGVVHEIRVSGVLEENGTAVLKGPHAVLECDTTVKMCQAVYTDISIDLDIVQKRLQAKGLSESEIQSKLEISRHFCRGGECIGIIKY